MSIRQLSFVFAIAVVSLLHPGCGGDTSQPDAAPMTLNPPPNIDAMSCYDLVASTDHIITTECLGCCNQRGFSGATSYGGHCVCGNPRDNSGATICAAEGASAAVCMDCCHAANSGYMWSGGTGSSGTCVCFNRADNTVCASALSAPTPETACQVCCLDNGYLGSGYTNISTPECSCIDA